MKLSIAGAFAPLVLSVACGGGKTGCPAGFVEAQGVGGSFCISAYEMTMTEGQLGNKDQGAGFPDGSTRIEALVSASGLRPTMTSWYQAYAACETQGWSLCTSEQWEDACDGLPGPGGKIYPSVDGEFVPGRCSIGDHRSNLSMPLTLTGEMPGCRTESGIFDMQGNLWEWVDSGARTPEGLPVVDKRGGGHYGAAPVKCSRHANGQHPPEWDGTIGFRCCTSP